MMYACRVLLFRPMSSVSRKRVAVSSVGLSTTKRRKTKAESSTITSTAVVEEPCQSSAPDIKAAIENLEHDTMGDSWRTALEREFMKPYFQKLKEFLIAEHHSHTIYPKPNDIYSWSRLTPLNSVKAVVLGQDPYHNVGQAHGLSFSVLPPTKLPGSLKNIYKQLLNDIPAFKVPTSGDLTPVAKAGVLWLNTCLTVRAHNANSHAKKGWETFTDAVIRAVLDRPDGRGVVFFAWGLPAQKLYDRLGIDEEKHLVLRSAHPSPLSAHRGFLGNGHFKKANEWLQKKHGEEIDWAALGSAPNADADP
ncbi:uracil-DNA glycosylase-like protein [Suillus paluster]|uniref:uracil-DNA glycosylase-like protein n=1 Tax=Suillus paluster TaxID=48578 RepID=UPI001B870395|nr:uracil-DNA glycosylase-like protein [Suillus paluster]KAG1748916.1 uracil-DNA glycosylase-like protein [Suillus paluster]